MKRYLNINDAYFVVNVNLKSTSSTHPACYAGRLCFHPDFLPSAHSSALPSVPLEADASVGFCPYRLYHLPFVGSLPFTKTAIF